MAGIGGYGNCIGVPTVGGEVQFAPAHTANTTVNVLFVGVVHRHAQHRGLTELDSVAVDEPLGDAAHALSVHERAVRAAEVLDGPLVEDAQDARVPA